MSTAPCVQADAGARVRVARTFVLLDGLQEVLRVEARHQNDRGALVQPDAHEDHHAIDVVQRQHGDHPILSAHARVMLGIARGLERVSDQVAVAEHHTLWDARRPTRIRQHAKVRRRVDRSC